MKNVPKKLFKESSYLFGKNLIIIVINIFNPSLFGNYSQN